jgi:sterol desaturase/sphingolipid hydroxylase (fatty acid hydroxylase superfamily)
MLTDTQMATPVLRGASGWRLALLVLHVVEVLGMVAIAWVLAEGAPRHQAGDGRALVAVLAGLALCGSQARRVLGGVPRLTPVGLATQGTLLAVAMSALLWDPALGVAGIVVTGTLLVAWGRTGARSPGPVGSIDDGPDPDDLSAAAPDPIESAGGERARVGLGRATAAVVTASLILGALAVRSTIVVGLVVLAAVFIPIERWFPLHPRPVLRRHWRTDLVHYLVNGSLLIAGVFAAVVVFGTTLRAFVPAGVRSTVAASPVWAQVLVAFAVATVGSYTGHREAHEVPLLWRFHRVHHSIREMDWLAANHLNPMDETFIRSCAVVPLFALGFGRASLGAYMVLLTFQAIFIHSNVRLTFGPLRWLVATPQFHHWHHARDPQAYNANYAGEFPAVDLLFGTCHLPDHWPGHYGVPDTQPEGYLRQLAWPFREPCRSTTPGPSAPESGATRPFSRPSLGACGRLWHVTSSLPRVPRGGCRRRAYPPTALATVVACVIAGVIATGSGAPARAASVTGTGPAAEPPAKIGPVGHVGRWLTDPSGRVLMLHGLNLVAKGLETPAQEGFGDADADWIAQQGFDVVRLGLTASALMPSPGSIDGTFLTSFAGTVHTLTRHGLLVLVDLHQDVWGPTLDFGDGFPGWMTDTGGAIDNGQGWPLGYATNPAIQAAFQSFWDNVDGPGRVSLQDRVGAMFRALARAVGSDTGVLGYDLMNEPWSGTVWQGCLQAGGCPTLDKTELDPYYARMAAAIRSVDPRSLLFGEPFVLFNFGTSKTSISLPGHDRRSGMAFHMYPTDAAHEPPVIANATTWARSMGGALLAGEFGVNGGSSADATGIGRQVSELDSALIPWIWWSFDGGVVPNIALPPVGTNLNMAAIDALVRPHPVAVAGTPRALSYSTDTRVMTFRYSTRGPDGQEYPSGTASSVSVPSLPYPTGWDVHVAGGAVVSPAGKSPVQVVAGSGARSVTITVTPAHLS